MFAYGATGSGKTHTMVGTAQDPGLMIRSMESLFADSAGLHAEEQLSITASYLEVYNEVRCLEFVGISHQQRSLGAPVIDWGAPCNSYSISCFDLLFSICLQPHQDTVTQTRCTHVLGVLSSESRIQTHTESESILLQLLISLRTCFVFDHTAIAGMASVWRWQQCGHGMTLHSRVTHLWNTQAVGPDV